MDEYSIGREIKRIIRDEISSNVTEINMVYTLQSQLTELEQRIKSQDLYIGELETNLEKVRKLALGFDELDCEIMDTLIENIPESLAKEAELEELAQRTFDESYDDLPF